MTRQVQPCGTIAAYERHRRAGEKACDACREAKRLYSLKHYTPSSRRLQPCGTVAAYQRHRARGEQACKDCRAAMTAYVTARKRRDRLNGILAAAWAEATAA